MKRATKWAIALVVSGAVHAGAAAILLAPTREDVQVAGSASLEIALLGSFEDAFTAGEPVDDVELVEPSETADPIEPVEDATMASETETEQVIAPVTPPVAQLRPDAAHTAPIALTSPATASVAALIALAPSETATIVEPLLPEIAPEAGILVPSVALDPTKEHTPDATTSVAPSTSEVVDPKSALQRPVDENSPSMAAPVVPPASEAVEPDTAIAMVSPIEQARPSVIQPVEETPATEPSEEIAIPDDVPLPTPRPTPPRVRETRERPEPAKPEPRRQEPQRQQAAPDPKPEKPKTAPQRKAGGADGQQDRNASRGQAEGRADGRASAQGSDGARNVAPGNARASNYPGQVVARLRRSLRSVPRSAIRAAQRDVHVAFTVNSGGGVGGVRITQSSGSPALDQAALASVQRAAPFPPIPADAGRANWQFSVPLGLAR